MTELHHRGFWTASSLALLALVVWGSLQTTVQSPAVSGLDKLEDLGTYFVLAVWFTGLSTQQRSYGWITAGLLALGLAMELAQFMMQAGRRAEPFDMLANAVGVLLGTLLGARATGGWARRAEAWWGAR